MGDHRLRIYSSEDITDDELDEVEEKIDFDTYSDDDVYEFNGHFIFTKDGGVIGDAVDGMCCGIIEKDIELANGEMVYFAFDHGH